MIYGDTHRVIFFLQEGMHLHMMVIIIIQHTTSLVSSGVCWLHNRPQLITSANVTLAKDQQQHKPPRSTRRAQPRLEFCVQLCREKLTKLLCARGWSHNFWKPPSGTTSSAVWPKDTTRDDFLCSSKSHNRFNGTVLGDCLQFFSSSCGDNYAPHEWRWSSFRRFRFNCSLEVSRLELVAFQRHHHHRRHLQKKHYHHLTRRKRRRKKREIKFQELLFHG